MVLYPLWIQRISLPIDEVRGKLAEDEGAPLRLVASREAGPLSALHMPRPFAFFLAKRWKPRASTLIGTAMFSSRNRAPYWKYIFSLDKMFALHNNVF